MITDLANTASGVLDFDIIPSKPLTVIKSEAPEPRIMGQLIRCHRPAEPTPLQAVG